jgi:hypothetical protein
VVWSADSDRNCLSLETAVIYGVTPLHQSIYQHQIWELLAWRDTGSKTLGGMLGGWSGQPEERTEGMDFKKKRWLLVDDFVRRFN